MSWLIPYLMARWRERSTKIAVAALVLAITFILAALFLPAFRHGLSIIWGWILVWSGIAGTSEAWAVRIAKRLSSRISLPRGPSAPVPAVPAMEIIMSIDFSALEAWSKGALERAAAAGAKAAEASLLSDIEAGLPGLSSDVQAIISTATKGIQSATAGMFNPVMDLMPFIMSLAQAAMDLEAKVPTAAASSASPAPTTAPIATPQVFVTEGNTTANN